LKQVGQGSWLFSQLAQMLGSGLDADRALGVLLRERQGPVAALERVRSAVKQGRPLPAALQRQGLIEALDRAVLEAMDAAGRLDAGLAALAERLEANERLAQRLKARLALPVAILVLAAFIAPLPTLFGSEAMGLFAYLWAALKPLVLMGAIAWALLTLGRFTLGRFVLGTPGGRQLRPGESPPLGLRRQVIGQLAVLLSAGLDAARSLSIMASQAPAGLRGRLECAADQVRGGTALVPSLADAGLVDCEEDRPLLVAAEEAGALPDGLHRQHAALTARWEARYELAAEWLPRLIYFLVLSFMAWSLISGPGFGPRSGPGSL